jgi:hypothetical protein
MIKKALPGLIILILAAIAPALGQIVGNGGVGSASIGGTVAGCGTNGYVLFNNNGVLGCQAFGAASLNSGASPTIAVGTCTLSSTNTQVGNGSVGTFSYASGTCTSGQTFTITLAQTATNGWNCTVQDRTTAAANPVKENSTTQTVVTMAAGGTSVAGDVWQFQCQAY